MAITERQAEASAPDVPEPLNIIGDRFIISLLDRRQFGDLHLMYTCEEVLMKLLLQIGPCNDGFASKEENYAKADSDSERWNR